MAPTKQTADAPQRPVVTAADPHHGDLRKGAYLRRRDEYRNQLPETTPAARLPKHG